MSDNFTDEKREFAKQLKQTDKETLNFLTEVSKAFSIESIEYFTKNTAVRIDNKNKTLTRSNGA